MGWGWDYVKSLAGQAAQHDGEIVHRTESARVDTVEGFEQAGTRLAAEPAMAAVRPQGVNPHDIYLMFHGPDAKGTGSLDSSVAVWRNVSAYHAQAGDALKSATSKLTAAWQGEAAESASAGITFLRDAADTASQRALHAGTVLEQQSSGWNDTAHKVTDVPADPPRMSIGQVDPITPVEFRTHATTYTAGQQANQLALSEYGSTTSSNSQNVPQFAAEAPQPIAPPASGRQDALPAASQADGGSPAHQDGGSAATSVAPGSSSTRVSSVQNGQLAAQTHSAWQMQGTLHQPDGGQTPPGQGAVPVAGMAAGGAGLIAGGGALMGASLAGGGAGTSGGASIGARLAGGASSEKPRSLSSSGTLGEEAESAESTETPRGARGRREEDEEDRAHRETGYLVEANPHRTFGHDRPVAPPVFGTEQGPDERAENA